jgi:hypothetical protein
LQMESVWIRSRSGAENLPHNFRSMDGVHRTSPEDEMLEVQLHHSTPILGAGAHGRAFRLNDGQVLKVAVNVGPLAAKSHGDIVRELIWKCQSDDLRRRCGSWRRRRNMSSIN